MTAEPDRSTATAAGERLRLVLASGLGLGLLPVAPGSFAALLGVAAHLAIAATLPPAWWRPALGFALALVVAAHFWLAGWAREHWGEPDSRHFVLDEVAGYLVVPILFLGARPWQVALWGFILFRVLDVVKVPPAWQIDRRMHNALGVVLDDVVSAAYAALALKGLSILSLRLGWEAWLLGPR